MKRVGQQQQQQQPQHMQDNNRWRRNLVHTRGQRTCRHDFYELVFIWSFLISFRVAPWPEHSAAQHTGWGSSRRRTLRQDVLATKKLDHTTPPKCQQKYDIKLRAHMQSTHTRIHTTSHTHTHSCNCSCCCFVLFKWNLCLLNGDGNKE